jgi:uncharacterized protein YndB with AHSA1/START domain
MITVSAVVAKPIEVVWDCWTKPEHIKEWCFASPDWEVGDVSNDVRTGGKFSTVMRAKDGSAGFDFNGVYTAVTDHAALDYTIEGGRVVSIRFAETDGGVEVTETFEMEGENSEELQRAGWQSILDNFKSYTEHLA